MTHPDAVPTWYTLQGTQLLLRLRIQPRASHEGLDGLHNGRLRIRISAPPVDGAANERLIRVLAQVLEVPRGSVRVLRGEKSRDKDVVVSGASSELAARLAQKVL